jgi:hypothetical protein
MDQRSLITFSIATSIAADTDASIVHNIAPTVGYF